MHPAAAHPATRYLVGISSFALVGVGAYYTWHRQRQRFTTTSPHSPKMAAVAPFQVSFALISSLLAESSNAWGSSPVAFCTKLEATRKLPIPFLPAISHQTQHDVGVGMGMGVGGRGVGMVDGTRREEKKPGLMLIPRLGTDAVCRAHDLRRVRQGHLGRAAQAPGDYQGRGKPPRPASYH